MTTRPAPTTTAAQPNPTNHDARNDAAANTAPFRTSVQLLLRTTPFLVFNLLVYGAFFVATVLWLAVFGGLAPPGRRRHPGRKMGLGHRQPLPTTYTIVTYHNAIAGVTVDPAWDERLQSLSGEFRKLVGRAREAAGGSGAPRSAGPADARPGVAGAGAD